MKEFDKFIEEAASKRGPAGQYYCFTDKKCKKIPMGYHVGRRGYLEHDKDDDTNGKKMVMEVMEMVAMVLMAMAVMEMVVVMVDPTVVVMEEEANNVKLRST